MKRLSAAIARQLTDNPYCLLSRSEIARVWPEDKHLARKLDRFAREHNWQVVNYIDGWGAMIARRLNSQPPT